jgi:hypothetical protein
MKFWRQLATNSLEIGVLSSFGFAQPLFNLLSKNAEFLVVRRSQPLDIFLLILVLCLLLPAALIVLELVAAMVTPRLLDWLQGFLITLLISITLLPVLKHLGKLPGAGWLALALVLGLGFAFAHWYFERVRALLLWLSPAMLIFPALFVANSSVRKIIFPKPQPARASVPQAAAPSAPVVMVIFDEFPLISLLDEHWRIDATLYPNFAALSQEATWCRNATSVSEGTLNAVPAIVDGCYPRTSLKRLPNAADYPRSLFRLVGKSYQFNVVENNTRLCPDDLCGESDSAVPLGKRMRGLLADISILYLYILLPSDLTAHLPDITHSWKDFATRLQQGPSPWLVYDQLTNWDDRVEIFRKFTNSIKPSPKPTLHFLHILLPHAIWEFLPSGKRYTLPEQGIPGVLGHNDRGADPNKWTGDPWLVAQGYQRHLLQVGLMDRLVGELINHLKRTGLYDPALIVITADHGASFRPNDSRRSVTRTNYPDIMLVPLFIKSPHQKEGQITDRNVETMDILPTMADILKIPLPWSVDGRSMLDRSSPERKQKLIVSDPGQEFVFESRLTASNESLKYKLSLFGTGRGLEGLFRIGPHNELIGRRIDSFPDIDDSAIECDIDGDSYFNSVDTSAPVILTHITGQVLHPQMENFKPRQLAVAANGIIQAVTQSYQSGNEERFAALLPESALQPGHNDVEIYRVFESDYSLSLAKTRKVAVPEYQWGSIVRLNAKGNGLIYQAEGWGAPEDGFTWTDGKRARLVLPVSPTESAVTLTMELCGYVLPGEVARQRVRISINQKFAGEWLVTDRALHKKTLKIPHEFLAGSPELAITLETPDAVVPASLGDGIDVRQLAIAISWLRATPQ